MIYMYLTEGERYQIYEMNREGLDYVQREIGRKLGWRTLECPEFHRHPPKLIPPSPRSLSG